MLGGEADRADWVLSSNRLVTDASGEADRADWVLPSIRLVSDAS